MSDQFEIVTREHEGMLLEPGDAPIAVFVFKPDQVVLRTVAVSVEALKKLPSASKASVLAAMDDLFRNLVEMIL